MLAFDFGERYLGVAVGDTEVGMAHPLLTIDARAAGDRFEAVADPVKGDILYLFGEIGEPALIAKVASLLQGRISVELRDAAEEALAKLRST